MKQKDKQKTSPGKGNGCKDSVPARPFPCKMRPKWPGLPGTRTASRKLVSITSHECMSCGPSHCQDVPGKAEWWCDLARAHFSTDSAPLARLWLVLFVSNGARDLPFAFFGVHSPHFTFSRSTQHEEGVSPICSGPGTRCQPMLLALAPLWVLQVRSATQTALCVDSSTPFVSIFLSIHPSVHLSINLFWY